MLKSSGGIGAATLASRVLGLVRDQSFAAFMGTHGVAAAFNYAFMVPNLFRRLLGEGALTAAFIPIFKAKEKNEGEASMWQAANAVISGLLVAAPAIVLLCHAADFAPVALGGAWDADTLLMFQLMRADVPLHDAGLPGRDLHGHPQRARPFFHSGAQPGDSERGPDCLRSGWLAPHFGQPTAHAGVCAGAGRAGWPAWRRRLFQLPPMRGEGFRYHWVSPWRDPTTREVVVKMIPSAIGVAAFQINVAAHANAGLWREQVHCGRVLLCGAPDGTAAGSVRAVAGHFSAADAVGAGGGKEFRAVPRHAAPGCQLS